MGVPAGPPVTWPADTAKAMETLAHLFPSMRNVPAVAPWDALALVAWLQSGAPTGGSRWVALFLLSVWDSGTDWATMGVPAPARFDLVQAWTAWDASHRDALMVWLRSPFQA
jgi:hypothetical protein